MFSDPVKNLKQFGLRENMIVADLGAGTGFYSIAAARMIPNGKVYSIEIQKDYINTIRNKAAELNLDNLECLLGNLEEKGGSKLGNEVVDAVIISNVLFQVENKNRLAEEAKRILKKNGMLLLIDWEKDSAFDVGLSGLLSKEEAVALFKEKGFKLDREIDAGEHHYGIILIREK